MMIRVAELSWPELQQHLYPTDGSLPDTFVLGTIRADWHRWADFVQARYPVVFCAPGQPEQPRIDLAAVARHWDDAPPTPAPRLRVQLGRCHLNCFFLAEDCIDGDIDPREIRTPDDHRLLLDYLTSLSRLLGKRVVVLAEGTRWGPGNAFSPAPLLTIDQGEAYAPWRRREAGGGPLSGEPKPEIGGG